MAVYDFKLNNKLIFFRAYNSTFSCFSPPSIELLFLGKNQKPQTHLVVGDAAAGEDPRPVFGGCDVNLRSLVFAESEELRLDHIYYLILGLNFNSLYSLTLSLTPHTFSVSCSLYSVPFPIAAQPSPSPLTGRLALLDRRSLHILQQSFRRLFELRFCLCVQTSSSFFN